MTWTSIFIAGILTYFTRMSMVTLIKKEMISDNLRKILNYVPSVVFPSIISVSYKHLTLPTITEV